MTPCAPRPRRKAKTAVIGRPGKKRVLFAAIMNDRDRAAGRAGVGRRHGRQEPESRRGARRRGSLACRPVRFQGRQLQIPRRLQGQDPGTILLRCGRTAQPITVVGTQSHGVFPTRNFQQAPSRAGNRSTARPHEEIPREGQTLLQLPIACGRVTRIPEGPFQGEGEGPEYETSTPWDRTAEWMIYPLSPRRTTFATSSGWTPSAWAPHRLRHGTV